MTTKQYTMSCGESIPCWPLIYTSIHPVQCTQNHEEVVFPFHLLEPDTLPAYGWDPVFFVGVETPKSICHETVMYAGLDTE